MTSKISFSKLVFISLRKHVWSIALAAMAMFFSLPVYAALQVSIVTDKLNMNMYLPELLMGVYRRLVFGSGNGCLFVGTSILAVVIAFNGFGYLFSKSKVDFYHGIPVSRCRLYMSNYLAGLVTYVVPYLIALLITFIVSGANGLLDLVGVETAFVSFGLNILGFLAIYTVTVVAIMLTGILPVAILGTVVLLFYLFTVVTLLAQCRGTFFVTYCWDENPSFLYLSPVCAYPTLWEEMDGIFGIIKVDANKILLMSLFIVCVTVVGLLLYTNRKSEATGLSLVYKKTIPVISILLLIPISFFGGMGFEMLGRTGNVRVSYPWLIGGCIISLILGHFIIQAIVYRDFKSLFKNLLNPLLAAVGVCFIICTFAFDLFSFNEYFPAEEDFESAAVVSYNFQNYKEYFNFDVASDETGYKNVWIDLPDYRFKNMQITDINLIKDLKTAALEDTKREAEEATKIQYSDDTSEFEKYTSLMIKYKLKNGKSKYRQYYLNIDNNFDLYNRLYSSEQYKKGVFDILTIPDEEICDFRFADEFNETGVEIPAELQKELVYAYRNDCRKQTAEDVKNSYPIGYIFKNVVINEQNYSTTYCTFKSYIYPEFTETLACLEKGGVDIHKSFDIDSVKSVTVSNYSNDDSGIYNERIFEYTDRDDIARLMEIVRPASFADAEGMFYNNNAQLDVCVRLEDSNCDYYYAFPKGSVPDFVCKDVDLVQ